MLPTFGLCPSPLHFMPTNLPEPNGRPFPFLIFCLDLLPLRFSLRFRFGFGFGSRFRFHFMFLCFFNCLVLHSNGVN